MSLRRRLAHRLMDHACAVMPPNRREWAAAMRAEFAMIPDGPEKFAWACGCVWACYQERINPMDVFLKSLVRAAVVWLWPFGADLSHALSMATDPRAHVYVTKFLWYVSGDLSVMYAGIFVSLFVCELLMARFWASPKRIGPKTLVRAAAVWLWPLGKGVILVSNFATSTDPRVPAYLATFVWHVCRDLSIFYAAIFIPLLICELLIAHLWHSRSALPA